MAVVAHSKTVPLPALPAGQNLKRQMLSKRHKISHLRVVALVVALWVHHYQISQVCHYQKRVVARVDFQPVDGAQRSIQNQMAPPAFGLSVAEVAATERRNMVECSERSALSAKLNMKPTEVIMQSENAKPKNAKRRKVMAKADALEIFGAALSDLALAGMPAAYTCEGGVLTITLTGVAEATDDEGVYFVPYVDPAQTTT